MFLYLEISAVFPTIVTRCVIYGQYTMGAEEIKGGIWLQGLTPPALYDRGVDLLRCFEKGHGQFIRLMALIFYG
jgi:hypothetical protein